MGAIEPKGNWKATTLDYDFVRSLSADRCLYCLSKQQAQILQNALTLYRYATRWYSPSDDTLDTDWIERTIDQVLGELMTDHCDIDTILTEIQNDITTINTNITTINTNLTVVNNNLTEIQIENKTIITNNTTINVALTLPSNTFTSDATDYTYTDIYVRYNAFCLAVLDWIYEVCYALIRANDPGYSLSGIVGQMNAYAQTLVNNAFAVLLGTVPGFITIADMEAAWSDTAAVNDVACAMITALQNQQATYASFKNALLTYTPPAYPDNRYILKQMIAQELFYQNAFPFFVTVLQQATAYEKTLNPTAFVCSACAVLPDYGCVIPYTWDLSAGAKNPWLIRRGVYQPGVGIVGTTVPGDTNTAVEMYLQFPTPCSAILGHNIRITRAKTPVGGNSWASAFYYLNAGVLTRYNTSTQTQTNTYPTPDVATIAIPTPPGGNSPIAILIYTDTPYESAINAGGSSSTCLATNISKIEFIT